VTPLRSWRARRLTLNRRAGKALTLGIRALVATLGAASASAEDRDPFIKSVSCAGTGEVTCTATQADHTVHITVSAPDDATGNGTGSGSAADGTSFKSVLTASEAKSVTVSGFTVRETANELGACKDPTITDGAKPSGGESGDGGGGQEGPPESAPRARAKTLHKASLSSTSGVPVSLGPVPALIFLGDTTLDGVDSISGVISIADGVSVCVTAGELFAG